MGLNSNTALSAGRYADPRVAQRVINELHNHGINPASLGASAQEELNAIRREVAAQFGLSTEENDGVVRIQIDPEVVDMEAVRAELRKRKKENPILQQSRQVREYVRSHTLDGVVEGFEHIGHREGKFVFDVNVTKVQ